jgi:hypothetical protein
MRHAALFGTKSSLRHHTMRLPQARLSKRPINSRSAGSASSFLLHLARAIEIKQTDFTQLISALRGCKLQIRHLKPLARSLFEPHSRIQSNLRRMNTSLKDATPLRKFSLCTRKF